MNVCAQLKVDVHLTPADIEATLASDALIGLTATPKVLPPKWFYDDAGSELFDQITRLDEYYPTRCETEILLEHAGEIARISAADTLIELGSGTSTKTQILLRAFHATRQLCRVVPFDVSEATLRAASHSIVEEFPGVSVHAVVGDFERHLRYLPTGGRRMVAFLGSTIGNLDPGARATLLTELRGSLVPGDTLLLGSDLVKDAERLVSAYDDAAGVTAAFNRNMLMVLNRELGANFDISTFVHVARWNIEEERIEMWLRSMVAQQVHLTKIGLDVQFSESEELRTEISTKFLRKGVTAELEAAGFGVKRWWTDAAGDFGLSLSVVR